MPLPIFVRSPWYGIASSIVMLATLAGALGALFHHSVIGPGIAGGMGGLLWPIAAALPLLRLSRADRRATIVAVRTGHSTGNKRLDRIAADRLATAALHRPDSWSNRIAFGAVAVVAVGIVVAASIIRSPWWTVGVVVLLLLFTPMIIVMNQKPRSDPDERLARLLSEMNADTAELE